jgi:oligoribonuclease NrnB/cAMP/cGMP phosphodiesterase (DHH superfamily)
MKHEMPEDPGANATILFHKDCSDGMGAAWAFMYLMEDMYDMCRYQAIAYGEDPPPPAFTCPNKQEDLYILDFSFSKVVLKELCSRYASVILIDHHKTALETIGPECWPDGDMPANLYVNLDMERSGAVLAWDVLHEYVTPHQAQAAPLLLRYIQDRDLWQWKLPFSAEINAYIQTVPRSISAYQELNLEMPSQSNPAYMREHEFFKMGKLLLQTHSAIVHDIIKATKRPFTLNGHKGLICNCTPQYASDVGNLLAKESGTFGATYYAACDDTHKFSLRSVKDAPGEVDVSKLAADMGGGGHKNAAGFSMAAPISAATGIEIWNIPPREFPDDYEVN